MHRPRPPRRTLPLVLGVGVLLAIVVRRSLVEVRGPSMEPTLWSGDRLMTVPARPAWLRPGQVVVLDDPEDAAHRIIKRVVAVDGRDVEARGDDPRRSTDGRRWGAVPATSIRRIAVTRWPQVRSPLTRQPDTLA